MIPRDAKTPALPLFRRLTGGMAIVWSVFAVVFAILATAAGWFGPGVLLFVGFVMATVTTTGYWPPRHVQ